LETGGRNPGEKRGDQRDPSGGAKIAGRGRNNNKKKSHNIGQTGKDMEKVFERGWWRNFSSLPPPLGPPAFHSLLLIELEGRPLCKLFPRLFPINVCSFYCLFTHFLKIFLAHL